MSGGKFAEKVMMQMGWSDGQGLGARRDGIKSAVKVKKKDERLGLGAEKQSVWTDSWWEKAFEDACAKNRDAAADSGEDSSDSEASSLAGRVVGANQPNTDRELVAACGGRTCRVAGKGKLDRVLAQERREEDRQAGNTGADLTKAKASRPSVKTQAIGKPKGTSKRKSIKKHEKRAVQKKAVPVTS